MCCCGLCGSRFVLHSLAGTGSYEEPLLKLEHLIAPSQQPLLGHLATERKNLGEVQSLPELVNDFLIPHFRGVPALSAFDATCLHVRTSCFCTSAFVHDKLRIADSSLGDTVHLTTSWRWGRSGVEATENQSTIDFIDVASLLRSASFAAAVQAKNCGDSTLQAPPLRFVWQIAWTDHSMVLVQWGEDFIILQSNLNAWSLTRWLGASNGAISSVFENMHGTKEVNVNTKDIALVADDPFGHAEFAVEHEHRISIREETRENIRLMRWHRKLLGIKPVRDGRIQIQPLKIDVFIASMDEMLYDLFPNAEPRLSLTTSVKKYSSVCVHRTKW